MESEKLINDLIQQTQSNLHKVEGFKQLNETILNHKTSPTSWSVLECVEHLNRYGDFYLPEIQRRINASTHPNTETFKSSWLGNYFAKSMLPKEKLNKMKTFKSMDPAGSDLNKNVLNRFIAQQNTLLDLLEAARKVSLTKTKTGISITPWLKLRLGDTFRVVIYHNLRHVLQAEKAKENAIEPAQT